MTQSATTTIWALDEALKYVQMGLRVFPLQPGTKVPMTAHGVKDATDDPRVIKDWWTRTPDAGIGLSARADKVGDPCFLEFDQRPWLPSWAHELNQTKPITRLHKSGGKESPHYIFKHTEKSLALGNCDGAKDGHEWFSFRAANRYIVAPPSIHPDSGKPYTVELDVEPVPIPDWLVDAIAAKGIREREFANDMPELDEDFDFEAFCDWIPAKLGDEDGSWYAFEECPVAGRRHKGQGVRGCALYYDGGKLGFKCHAAECPSNADRRPGQSGIGFLVSFLSKEHEPFDGIIWDEQSAEELAEEFGAVDVEKEKDEREAKLVAARFAEKAKDFKPGTVVPCAKCGGVVFKEMVPKGEEPRCPDHSFATEHLEQEARLAASGPETEIAAPAFSRGAPAGALGEFEVQAGTNSKGDVIQLMGTLASDIEPEALEWLWRDKIPAGKITLFAGQPDCGKTLVMLDFIARVTTGKDFPDGTKNERGPQRVLLAATEDDLKSTLIPRLIAAGADLTKVVILQRVVIKTEAKQKTKRRILQLTEDAKLLKLTLRNNPDIAVVALDPISSYFGDCDPNKDKEVRPVMEAIADACESSKAAFVGIIHNNKRGDADAIGKILGASSIVGVSRAVWGFARDKEKKDEYYMALVKGNLARKRTGMKYQIIDATVVIADKNEILPRTDWLGESEESADEVLQRNRDADGTGKDSKKIDKAKALVQTQLERGDMLLRDLYREAEKQNISAKTIQRANRELGIYVNKQPSGPWWVSLDRAEPWYVAEKTMTADEGL